MSQRIRVRLPFLPVHELPHEATYQASHLWVRPPLPGQPGYEWSGDISVVYRGQHRTFEVAGSWYPIHERWQGLHNNGPHVFTYKQKTKLRAVAHILELALAYALMLAFPTPADLDAACAKEASRESV